MTANKLDNQAIHNDIRELMHELKKDISEFRQEIHNAMSELRQEIHNAMSELMHELEQFERRLTIKMGVLMVIYIGVIAALVKLL